MKYVDWVEQVLNGLVAAVAPDPAARTAGVEERQLLQELLGQQTTRLATDALRDAVRDLERLGLARRQGQWIEPTQAGKQLAAQSLRMLWPEIMDIYLENDQLTFLETCARICEECRNEIAVLRDVAWQQVTEALDLADPDFALVSDIAHKLQDAGLLDIRSGLGQRLYVHPTYAGIVRCSVK